MLNFTIPTDPHELAWLTDTAVKAHCSIASMGRFTVGFGAWYYSSVSHLLAEMKHTRSQAYGGKLLPMLAALSALDQFGDCYEPVPLTFPPGLSSKSGIIKSAHNFLAIAVDTADSDALYALRNGLMHQSSLISIGKQKVPKHYWFEIDDELPMLFSHASAPWDGVFSTRGRSNLTKVNSRKIIDLALNLVDALQEHHARKALRISLANGLEELLTNYVIFDFNNSFRDCYLRYLGNHISSDIDGSPQAVFCAQQVLANVASSVQMEAAQMLLNNHFPTTQIPHLLARYPGLQLPPP